MLKLSVQKLNSPTEDTTQAIANSRLPEQQQSTNIPSAGPTPAPQQGFSNNQSTGPGPFEASPGTNQTTPSGGPKKQDPCDGQVAPVGAYRSRVAEGRRGIFGLARRAEGEDAEGIPPTWDRATDRRIKKRPNFNIKIIDMFRKIQLKPSYKKKKSHFLIKNTFTEKPVKKRIKKILKEIL